MTVPDPCRVMWSGQESHLGGWARISSVTLTISLAIVADNSTVFLLPIVEGLPCMTYRDHLLFE